MNELAPEQMLRLFIALPVPESVKTEIERAQNQLKLASPEHGIRWTKSEQFHVTLKFLGGVEAARVPTLIESVRAGCRKLTKLELCAKGVGFFPHERKTRVFWVGTKDQADRLSKLYEAVQIATCEFATENTAERFTGHITLGRVKIMSKTAGQKLRALAAEMKDRPFGEWIGDHLEMVQSELSPAGAHYTVLAKISLGAELTTI
ncbi:MAG TPA: RNA 2',3'-cyclic phosphodiesterase [Verrucomicrobiae bacterium]|nr:RNA 2',3'-cyclic phosphodiesterase [Verrucomicrobiae bacterium]